jgi:hypothetical protein
MNQHGFERSTAARFVGQIRGRATADWMELMAQTDDSWIYAVRQGRGCVKRPPAEAYRWSKKPPVSVPYRAEDWTDQRSERIDRMMECAHKLRRA